MDPWTFLTVNYTVVAAIESVIWSISERRLIVRPSQFLWVMLELFLFSGLAYMLLVVLLRSRAQTNIRPNFLRLLWGVVYVNGGPVLLYSLATVMIGGLLFLGVIAAATREIFSPMGSFVAVLVIVFGMVVGIITLGLTYGIRVILRLYKANILLTVPSALLICILAIAGVSIPVHTIRKGDLTDTEAKAFEEVRSGSIVEWHYIYDHRVCGDLHRLKDAVHEEKMESFDLLRLLASSRVRSDDYGSTSYGYQLQFGRNPRDCGIDATPVKPSTGGQHSFYAPPHPLGAVIFAADHEGGYASARDKLVLIWPGELPSD